MSNQNIIISLGQRDAKHKFLDLFSKSHKFLDNTSRQKYYSFECMLKITSAYGKSRNIIYAS